MSESMSPPWIRDYLIDVAETHGAQIYNTSVTQRKKKVQLTDFLTYQENSYIWAWASDKDYRISIRISKGAIDEYKKKHGRSVIESRFFLVFIGKYRPVFSPRPLGPDACGNTSGSHISLEVDYVSLVGIGGHLFGNPRDLESDDKMKEWVLGLRQDGGGGNVLKLRKQQELLEKREVPLPPMSPLQLSLCAPVSQPQMTRDAEDDAKFQPARPHDFKRAYAKRWRTIELDPWKYLIKPVTNKQPEAESSALVVKSSLETASQPESCSRESLARHTPSPTPIRRQGTPTEWSPSIRGSPFAPEEAKTMVSGQETEQQDKQDVLPATPHPPSDVEGHVMDTAVASDARSLQPPTPAQRIKHSSLPRSSPPPCSSSVRSRLSHSSPPPPNSSLPPPSSFSIPEGGWKNIQRKVPHPGSPAPPPNFTNQGPARILVPNSDTSGSQSCSQPWHPSQSYCQHQSQTHLLTFSSCLSREFQPADESTPREGVSTRQQSKTFAESLLSHDDIGKQEAVLPCNKYSAGNPNVAMGRQEGSYPTRLHAQGTGKVEVLEVGTSDTEEEADVLQLTDNDARVGARPATLSKTQDASGQGANAGHEDSQLSTDDADIHLRLQGVPPQTAVPNVLHTSPAKQDTENISIRPSNPSPETPERPGSRSSTHSLFSASFEDEQSIVSQLLISPMSRNEDEEQQKSSPPHGLRHDSEAWKQPSFMSKDKGKGKARAVEEPATPSVAVGKKRRRSARAESPVLKRVKHSPGTRRDGSSRSSTDRNAETSALRKTQKRRPPTSSKDIETAAPPPTAQKSKPRLANFIVDFESIDLGKGIPMARLDLDNIKSTLLRTGRIRTQKEKVEKDGSVYIHS